MRGVVVIELFFFGIFNCRDGDLKEFLVFLWSLFGCVDECIGGIGF